MPKKTYRQAINEALRQEMERDHRVILMGEDISAAAGSPGDDDAWGGPLGVTKGLSTIFGRERVLDTPITESAFIGAAAGAAATGLRPVAELMFVDFMGVCFDQIFNQAAKFKYMFGGKAVTPLVIRTMYGAGFRAASQHSQCLYPIFTHIPGLKVALPSNAYEAKGLLIQAIRDDDPVIFFEHKAMYDEEVDVPDESYTIPFGEANVSREGDDVTIVAFGRMVNLANQVADKLDKDGISCTVVDPRTTSPLDEETILETVEETGRVVIVDEAHPRCNMATDVNALITQNLFAKLKAAPRLVTAPHAPVPFSPALEDLYIPSADKIEAAVRAVMGKTQLMANIQAIVMPKWGLAMQEGMLAAWHVDEGATIEKGQEIADIETSKIANVFESPIGGTVRRRVAGEGETVPVGALLAVVAEADTDEVAIDAFVADFQEAFKEQLAAAASAGALEPETVELEDGRRIRYLAMGEGEAAPIVLVHGFGGDLNNWMFNQPALAEKHRTYALDLPGHGGSSKDVGEGTVPALADALRGWMAKVEVERAHFVGHSLGAAVSLELALSDPRLVASLTLICPAGLGAEIEMAYIDGFIDANRRKKMEPVLQMLVHDASLVSSDMIEDVLKFKRLDGVDAALKSLRTALFPGGQQAAVLRDRLSEVEVPVQVIWGKADRIVPADHAAGLPGTVAVKILDDTGHLAHMERAGEVNGLIEAQVGGG